ncbi:surface antigen [Streptococcus criceti]|uniref:Bsp family protein n=1 Tax=Streptococcus criceti HS-6 TaxID=873449 RepID=G5JQM9_STRCG|nr:LD-carboxypeptidase LdcB/DacB [Streptococcus criceti]EHI74428.1 bsp family protein [Streptococcus criceti HS-6]SUN43065.1 surface antigen [Streptococcus criceti]
MKRAPIWNERQRFSIRKYSFGAASVLIGASLFFGGQVLADEQAVPAGQPQDQTVQTVADQPVQNGNSLTSQTEDSNTAVLSDKASVSQQVSQDSAQATAETSAPTDAVTSTAAATPARVDTATQTDVMPAQVEAQSAVQTVSVTSQQNESLAPTQAKLAVTRASVATTVQAVGKDIPSSGYYTYPERTEVKNSPSASAPLAFYANAGDRVYYDQVLTQDGYQWLSYKSYSGIRRYANIAKLEVKEVPAPSVPKTQSGTGGKDIPSSGYYTYPERTEVKNSPSASAPLAFYANAGDRVYYDQVLTQDGYQWLSYKSYSGIRRYANIAKLEVKEVPAPKTDDQSAGDSETTFPTLQRYTFDREVAVKNEARAAAKTEFTFTKGEGVNYDKELKADGYKWISYVSYSGIRRYVMLDKLSNSQPSESKLTGQISVENQTNQGFDVRISNVSDSKGILAVKVPIWTDRNDQDDIIWYDGVKQGDGTYKVAVKLSDHKNETGTYNIHLYYVETDGAMKGVAAQQVKVAEPQVTRTGTLSFSNKDNGDFDVIVSTVTDSQGLKAVKVPVWTDRNDQDDIIWYDGVKQADGTYKVTVRVSDHKNETGLYNVHLYYLENDGKLVGITGQQHRSEAKKMDKRVTGTLAIQNQTSDGFDVLITNVSNSNGIVAVKVPVWTSNRDQDDIIWYDANKQADGDYKVTVKISDHKGQRGVYNIHLYYVENDNKLVGVAATQTTVPEPTPGEKKSPSYNGSYYYVAGKHGPILIVNKKYALSSSYNPGENAVAKDAFVRLRNDMINQGYNVGYAYSGFRTYDYQKNFYQSYVNQDGQAAADRYSARPGYSEHQTGLTFDLTDRSGNLLEDQAAAQWLRDNAHRYGFIVRYQLGKESITGFMQEPWHIRYIGQEAQDIHESGLSLEEYLGVEGGDYGSPANSPLQSHAQANAIPSSGRYTFTRESYVRSAPSQSSPALATYTVGQSVNYDSVRNAEGKTWISYIAYSGNRRYIAID